MKKISPKILVLLCVVSLGLTGQLSAMQKNKDLLQFKSKKPGILLSKRAKIADTLWERGNWKELEKEFTYFLNKGNIKKLPPTVNKDKFLVLAADLSNLFLVKHLVEKEHVEINYLLGTALYYSRRDSFDIVKYLVEKGANVNAKDTDSSTPLHYAVEKGDLEIVKYLVKNGANVNAKDNEGRTPLYFAARNGMLEIVKYLVEKGTNVNTRDNLNITPLHSAIYELEIVEYLVKTARAKTDIKDNFGRIPLDYVKCETIIVYVNKNLIDALDRPRGYSLFSHLQVITAGIAGVLFGNDKYKFAKNYFGPVGLAVSGLCGITAGLSREYFSYQESLETHGLLQTAKIFFKNNLSAVCAFGAGFLASKIAGGYTKANNTTI